jgi:hypothetical protein
MGPVAPIGPTGPVEPDGPVGPIGPPIGKLIIGKLLIYIPMDLLFSSIYQSFSILSVKEVQ